jgi:hypothetical protein
MPARPGLGVRLDSRHRPDHNGPPVQGRFGLRLVENNLDLNREVLGRNARPVLPHAGISGRCQLQEHHANLTAKLTGLEGVIAEILAGH